MLIKSFYDNVMISIGKLDEIHVKGYATNDCSNMKISGVPSEVEKIIP